MAKLKPRPGSDAHGSLPGVLFHGVSQAALDEYSPPSRARDPAPDSLRRPELVAPSEPPAESGGSWSLPPLAPAEPLPRLVSSGTYDVALELGGGAMATVYMAVKSGSNGFKKVVALKRIHKHLAGNATFVDMLVDEARLASRINHPNVCQVLDFGCDDSGYYIALEFLSGQTLQSVFEALQDNPAIVARSRHQFIASRIVASLAQGLHAAHGLKGEDGLLLDVVHRDVTPHNAFLLYDGVAKVTDFGVARARSRIHHTTDGNLKGKLAYMAPEQMSRGQVDRRADVFSLGVVFWELLTGRRLFDYKTEAETLSAVCSGGAPAPSRYQPAISPKLDQIVLRALAAHEEDRYQSARELSQALETFLAQASDTVPQIDLVDWVEGLFPGAAQHAEELQRQATESPSKVSAQGIRLAPASSVAQLKTAHVLDADLWPMGDSSPPSNTARSVDIVARRWQAAPVAVSRPRASPVYVKPRAETESAPESSKRSAAATLAMTVIALGLGVACGLLALKSRSPAGPTLDSNAIAFTPSPALAPRVQRAIASLAPGNAASAPATVPAPTADTPSDSAQSSSASAPKAEVAPAVAPRASPVSAVPSALALASTPVAQTGAVFISTTGGPAAVLVGGNRVGQTPTLVNLPTGHRTLTLSPLDGAAPREVAVDITPNNTVVLKVALSASSPAPSAATPSATASSPTVAQPSPP